MGCRGQGGRALPVSFGHDGRLPRLDHGSGPGLCGPIHRCDDLSATVAGSGQFAGQSGHNAAAAGNR